MKERKEGKLVGREALPSSEEKEIFISSRPRVLVRTI